MRNPSRRDRRQERRLVGEVPVQRGARHAERAARRPKRQAIDAVRADGADRGLKQGATQVAVVVAVGAFAGRPWRTGRGHVTSSYTAHVDIVNMVR